MSIGLDAKLVETAYKRSVSRNEFNDVVYQVQGTGSPCLYRDNTTQNRSANSIEVAIDGLLWFGPTEDVARGDVYYHPSEGFLQIERVIKAKRLVADNALMFIKCEVTKQRQVS